MVDCCSKSVSPAIRDEQARQAVPRRGRCGPKGHPDTVPIKVATNSAIAPAGFTGRGCILRNASEAAGPKESMPRFGILCNHPAPLRRLAVSGLRPWDITAQSFALPTAAPPGHSRPVEPPTSSWACSSRTPTGDLLWEARFSVLVGRILRATDGRMTWKRVFSTPANRLDGVFFLDANTGTAVGDFGTILHTADGGDTWAAQSSGTTLSLRSVSFVDTPLHLERQSLVCVFHRR